MRTWASSCFNFSAFIITSSVKKQNYNINQNLTLTRPKPSAIACHLIHLI